MTKFKLYDCYKEKILIGKFNRKKDLAKRLTQYENETDGECYFVLYMLGPGDVYRKVHNWRYSDRTVKFHLNLMAP